MLRELIAKYKETAAHQIAEVYAVRGEVDLAFEWLERAYAHHDPSLSGMKSSFFLHSLRADSRWGVLLRKMGLAD